MRVGSISRAFVLGTLLLGAASCGSVASNHPDSGGGTGGQTAADGGTGGSGGVSASGGSTGAGGVGAGTGGMSGGTGGASGTGILVHGGIGPLAPAPAPGAVLVVNPRIGGPGPRTCGTSACVVRGGIVP